MPDFGHIDLELTKEQMEKLSSFCTILAYTGRKKHPVGLVAQVFVEIGVIRVHLCENYLMKKIIRSIQKAILNRNRKFKYGEIKRRDYIKYYSKALKIAKLERLTTLDKLHSNPTLLDESNNMAFGGRFKNKKIEDDIPF